VWRLFYDLGPDPVTGKRRQRTRTVQGSRREAERQLSILVGQAAAGTLADPKQTTVAEFTDRWLRLVEGTVRPTTLDGYREKLALANRWIGRRRLAHLTGELLSELYRTLPRSAQTVLHVHRVLHRMLQDAQRWGLLPSNPAAAAIPPKVRRARPRTWTADQVAVFLEFTGTHELGPLVRVAASTGMRRGELCGLRWTAVDLSRGVLTVEQSTVMVGGRPLQGEPKTRAGRRRVALDPATVDVLASVRQRQQEWQRLFGGSYQPGWVFCWPDGRPFSPDWVSHRFHDLVLASGLPQIRLHDLRHTHATLALEAGVPAKVVADRLGHAGIQITLDTYTHHVEALDRQAAVAVAGLIGNRTGNSGPKAESVAPQQGS
jgi:integrase